jgi:hypothetical protein
LAWIAEEEAISLLKKQSTKVSLYSNQRTHLIDQKLKWIKELPILFQANKY